MADLDEECRDMTVRQKSTESFGKAKIIQQISSPPAGKSLGATYKSRGRADDERALKNESGPCPSMCTWSRPGFQGKVHSRANPAEPGHVPDVCVNSIHAMGPWTTPVLVRGQDSQKGAGVRMSCTGFRDLGWRYVRIDIEQCAA